MAMQTHLPRTSGMSFIFNKGLGNIKTLLPNVHIHLILLIKQQSAYDFHVAWLLSKHEWLGGREEHSHLYTKDILFLLTFIYSLAFQFSLIWLYPLLCVHQYGGCVGGVLCYLYPRCYQSWYIESMHLWDFKHSSSSCKRHINPPPTLTLTLTAMDLTPQLNRSLDTVHDAIH